MNYKLKNTNGRVTFLLRTGKDLVRNTMSIASAQHIIDTGAVTKSDVKGYPISVDDKWFFEGELFKKTAPQKAYDVLPQSDPEVSPKEVDAE